MTVKINGKIYLAGVVKAGLNNALIFMNVIDFLDFIEQTLGKDYPDNVF